MKLENRFTVPVPRDEAWRVLLDVERVAPCMPGAKLLGRDGDSFEGQVKVKVGPINLTYGGTASFVSLDEAAGIAVLSASGKETRGTGTAKATITCRLVDQGASTDVEVDTDLHVTGKPAQFGRGVLADVSAKLVDQFAACVAEEIQEGTPTASESAGPAAGSAGDPASVAAEAASALAAVSPPDSAPQTPAPAAPRPPRRESAPIDLVDTAGLPVLKRALPVLAGLALVYLVLRRLFR
jgi:carbon monoxide dehydrogenase subunit G